MKSSFSNCVDCVLKEQSLVPGELSETCNNSLKNVELIVFAEAPSHEEIVQKKPLCGRAGSIFRKAFSESGLDRSKYYITNVVLCSNIIDGKTVTPPQEAVDICKPNWKELLKRTNPSYIIVMGSTAAKSLGLLKDGESITDARNDSLRDLYVDDKKIKCKITYHPSYILRNLHTEGFYKEKFLEDFNYINGLLTEEYGSKSNCDSLLEDTCDNKDTGIYSFSIPKEYYNEEYVLIDIQNMRNYNQILYIFRNTKTGEKEYYKTSSEDSYYYELKDCKENSINPMIVDVKNTTLKIKEKFGNSKKSNQSFYESDLRTELKHSIDYRYNRHVPEKTLELKILYFDIEIYNFGEKDFPDPKKAEKPINSISFTLNNNKTNIFLLKHSSVDWDINTKFPDKYNVKIFTEEKALLKEFFSYVKNSDADVLSGYNVFDFDFVYLYNRSRLVGVDFNLISPIKSTYVNNNIYGEFNIYGISLADQLNLFKTFTYSVEASYKLDNISKKVLGEGKTAYEGTLDEIYKTDIVKFVEYSCTDTELIRDINNAKKHIELYFELVSTCCSTWACGRNTMGLVDPLCISYAKNMNMVCRDSLSSLPNSDIIGGFVKNPQAGLHEYIIDLDYASLYPNIICTFNIGPNTYIGKIERDKALKIIYDRESINKNEYIEVVNLPITNSKLSKLTYDKFIKFIDDKKLIVTSNGTIFKNHDTEISFFTKILLTLLESRSEYKKLMKKSDIDGDKEMMLKYKNKQESYKIVANSMYGVLANNRFRFYNLDLAETVTTCGQEIIKFSGYHLSKFMNSNSKEIDEKFLVGYEDRDIPYIIYQDTDSIFLDIGLYLSNQK